MKIIKEADFSWKGPQITCSRCGAVFEINEKDFWCNWKNDFWVVCPTKRCKQECPIEREQIPWFVQEQAKPEKELEDYLPKPRKTSSPFSDSDGYK
ncbi:MAG: hypothetical protein UU08_C0012G0011 [Candidatus Uhrbacteria bacterium GW2011_GWE2_40_58]|nr:MAG: hypothetical protein UT94_C0011G0008 [Candidatus Uhrbacteria bacterium GW2011_GWF2_40_263]KKR67647.1 MAG: hypothetical protein UU08_C0012G0011 [Candidatus Uhrbacteria bacterium GW2011_GWE2_40_58]OGL94426.1 MAG: hypothetical protein A2239_01935 [Candidatus Uhrbacteria bacterium RIFOXYA2_FULL_40_9]OGL96672.1 MAG: hypothetical protein A2332_05105 [Candidatus Uhrbacteria bacterium RIFOXYB2_FULL_41_18]HBK34713.1 hypothetical protein [Candidatus Uhrbacteria bacterium]